MAGQYAGALLLITSHNGSVQLQSALTTPVMLLLLVQCRRHGDTVFAAEGLLPALGDHLQQQRDKEVRRGGPVLFVWQICCR